MRVIERIIGGRTETKIAPRLHDLEHRGAVDVLAVASPDVARRRLRAVTQGGEEVALALPRDQTLFDGAVLVLEADRALVVRVGGQRWLRLSAERPADALELGYQAGNLHWRVRFSDGVLLVAVDGAVEDYLARLGDLVASGRVAHAIIEPGGRESGVGEDSGGTPGHDHRHRPRQAHPDRNGAGEGGEA